ncbi:MAG: nitroreductase family protein [Tessaracoccus sp.]|jgi:nitroreductase|uniref:nitroreductase family protein n=1 Tax=Tessaracoccus sp. TaxID=1971211 RepID=UPI001ED4DA0E|nr:nitroreductase family protein [Tessaracoccus sp.]MBK7822444.1 nitroreductase family protein [Tessaracoccus sp.]
MPAPISRVSQRILSGIKVRREFSIDCHDYLSTSGHMPDDELPTTQRERDITIAYHQVEKGLSLPEPKRPFGQSARDQMTSLSQHPHYLQVSEVAREATSEALEALDLWANDEHISPAATPAGVAPMARPELDDFFASRRSCRNYDMSRPVSEEALMAAVSAAQQAPSVCNRQAGRVRILTEPAHIKAALRLQNGNRGFTDGVPTLAIVTVDRRYFRGPGERNQRWIDGALFAMTLVWALHAQGLATCMLNWSMGATATRALRECMGFGDELDVICMVAIGHPAAGFHVARSRRRPQADVLTWNEGHPSAN